MHLTFIQQLHAELKSGGFDHYNFEIRSLDSTTSTNDYAANLLGLYENVIVLSKTQIKGRGRSNNKWFSPEGGLWLSIAIQRELEVMELSTPVTRAVQKIIGRIISCEIKPPNDILINGRKVAGILVEGKISGKIYRQIVIGIGINVVNAIPDELDGIATSLLEHTRPPTVESLAVDITMEVLKEIYSLF